MMSGDSRPANEQARVIGRALASSGQSVSVAESSAGGLVSAALVSVPGASAWFLGGVVPYSSVTRESWLGITDLPEGAVSGAMAARLAVAVRARTGSTWGVGETGIAGPQSGRRSTKLAGQAFVAVDGPSGTRVEEVRTSVDDRSANQEAFAEAALALLALAIGQGSVDQ